jgi:hypothetical protein
MQRGAMRRGISEARGAEAIRLQHRVACHRPVAIKALAHGHARMLRLHH